MKLMAHLVVLMCGFDAVATLYGINAGTIVEVNPIMLGVMKISEVLFVLVKMTLTYVAVCVIMRLSPQGAERFGFWAMVFVTSVYTTLTLWHSYLLLVN